MIGLTLDSQVSDAVGYTVASSSIILQISTALNIGNINPYITAITGLAGFVFLIYKIINARLDNKIKKQQLNKEKNIDITINKNLN